MKFFEVPGHYDIKKQLKAIADAGKIPHALLLEGPEGIGKHALARAFLQYVGCSHHVNGDSCGVCPSCRQHESLQHIDTIYSFPYVKKKSSSAVNPTLSADYLPEFIEFVKTSPFMDETIWLETLGMPNTKPIIYVEEANALIRRLSFSSHSSKYNSVILWQVDRLNEAAANKLLKVIEEPPGDSIIIMTSSCPMNILPTIYSRAQRIKVKRLSDDEISSWLVDSMGIDAEFANSIAPLAEGSVTEALRLVSKRSDSARFLDYFIQLMRLAYTRNIAALKDWSQTVAAEKRDTIVDFLEYCARMVRENFVANMHDDALNRMSPEELNFSINFARFVNENNAESLFSSFGQAITDIRGNVNPKIVLLDLAISVILLLKRN